MVGFHLHEIFKNPKLSHSYNLKQWLPLLREMEKFYIFNKSESICQNSHHTYTQYMYFNT